MKSETYPLAVPADLFVEVRRTAKETGLSPAEAMRQSLKLGLPKLREQRAMGRITNVEPLPDQVARRPYSAPDDDADAIQRFMAAQAMSAEEGRRTEDRGRRTEQRQRNTNGVWHNRF